MTAFTFRVTLSRVMMSCGGTSRASCRKRDAHDAIDGSEYKDDPRSLGLWKQAAEAEDDAALVFGKDLDRTEQVKNDDDNDNDWLKDSMTSTCLQRGSTNKLR